MTNEYEEQQEQAEEIGSEELDAKEAQSIHKANRPLSGDYATDPESFGELTVTREVNEEDGRVSYQFAGRARSARRGHEEVVNFLRFRLSSERRPKKDFESGEVIEGKDDLRSRLYAEAFNAFVQANDDATPKKMSDLTAWLASTPNVRLNTMAGDAGDLIVLHVKAPRG